MLAAFESDFLKNFQEIPHRDRTADSIRPISGRLLFLWQSPLQNQIRKLKTPSWSKHTQNFAEGIGFVRSEVQGAVGNDYVEGFTQKGNIFYRIADYLDVRDAWNCGRPESLTHHLRRQVDPYGHTFLADDTA